LVVARIIKTQEPGFVVVGRDPTSGEMQYAYTSNQGGFLGPVMSVASPADVAAQQSGGLVQSKCVMQAGGERAGAGDAQDTMTHGVPGLPVEISATGHQGTYPITALEVWFQ
jgi:hypothetical protein